MRSKQIHPSQRSNFAPVSDERQRVVREQLRPGVPDQNLLFKLDALAPGTTAHECFDTDYKARMDDVIEADLIPLLPREYGRVLITQSDAVSQYRVTVVVLD